LKSEPCGIPGCLRPGCGSGITIEESKRKLAEAIAYSAQRLADVADQMAVDDVKKKLGLS